MKVKTIRCPICRVTLTYTVRLSPPHITSSGVVEAAVFVNTDVIRAHVAEHKREVPCV